MVNKKLFSFFFTTALLAGIFTLHSCIGDGGGNYDLAEKGEKAAQGLCDCLNETTTDTQMMACYSIFENRYEVYIRMQLFNDAFNREIVSCDSYFAFRGIMAAHELCDHFRLLQKQP